MAGFIRRYLSDPGLEEITAIEGVVIIDREPPASITGVGTGTVCVVGEFEDGCYNDPLEVMSGTDLLTNFGGFGFTYDGVVSNNPCARVRHSDSVVRPEYWNGNGFVALVNKKFRRLVIVRVDTSVGAVQFVRLASALGNDYFTWNLEPGQTVVVKVDGAGAATATFDAAAALYTSAAGGAVSFVGGEAMTLVIDEGRPNQVGPYTVVFLASDTTRALIRARINSVLGYAAAADGGSDKTTITGICRGLGGNVKITAIGAAVATATGIAVTTTNGTGDVADIDMVTFAEAKARIEGDIVTLTVDRDASGLLRMSSKTLTGTSSVEVTSATTATAFGFTTGVVYDSAGIDGFLPAGSRVRNVGGTEWVTMAAVEVTAANRGPYSVKVRPAVDDGTTAGALPSTVTVVPAALPLGAWAVTNPLSLTAALTEPQLDTAYLAAIDSTLNPNTVGAEVNIIVSARQSNMIRAALRSNALVASAQGLRGRIAPIRPPLGTSRATARSTTTQPGVGAYRDQRVDYCYPGGSTSVPQIAARGLAGGTGFTADGIVDVGADTWLASTMCQLPPEENPGQATSFMALLLGLERNNPDVQDLRESDYRAFKAAGIVALRMDAGNAIFQSGVTSVDPLVQPNLKNISRRRMADYIQDSLAARLKAFIKKLANRDRRGQIVGEIDAFMSGLVSKNNPASQRIDSYTLDALSGNTPTTLAAGVFRIILKARTLPSLDEIVLETVVGENVVTVQEAA